jgi:hypothetical protein
MIKNHADEGLASRNSEAFITLGTVGFPLGCWNLGQQAVGAKPRGPRFRFPDGLQRPPCLVRIITYAARCLQD